MIHGRISAARLGLLAVLFQAILYGWHHHELRFPSRLPAAVIENPTSAPQALDDGDDCEICQVLHHQAAAPPGFAAAPLLPAIVAGLTSADIAFIGGALGPAFRARAPPRA